MDLLTWKTFRYPPPPNVMRAGWSNDAVPVWDCKDQRSALRVSLLAALSKGFGVAGRGMLIQPLDLER